MFVCYIDRMDRIFMLCQSMKKMDVLEVEEAVVRMCIAHVLNGHAYIGMVKTAISYLESLEN